MERNHVSCNPELPSSAQPKSSFSPAPSHNLAAVASAMAEVEVVPEPGDDYGSGIYVGLKVRHAKFGVGTIRKLEGKGDDQKAIVWFAGCGPKKLLLRFAGLERA